MDSRPLSQGVAAVISGATQAVGQVVTAVSGATQAVAHTGFALFMDGVYYTIMVPLVYVAVAAMIVGIIAKIARIAASPAPVFTLKTFPSRKHPVLAALSDTFAMPQIRKRKPVFWFFLMWFHVGILFLILGHFDLFPKVNIMPEASRHMIGAGFVGISVTVPAFYFLGRRFRGEDRHISVPSDYLLLLILIFTFLLGDMISWGNSWTANGFVMTKADFKLYFGVLSSFSFADPKTVLPGSHYHFIVLHVFLAEIFMAILPFSKIVHTFFSLPLNILRRK
ncbi:MAG: respiratory nitrate reductase subunit gamma [Spirochaetes bacterium]|nr:respiratory nitrate reductase subunit gamma [Spirochaetota bacterium]